MDTSKAVTHVGLCAGYGGIELGLKRAIPSLRTIALCEVEAFAVANLVAKMESGRLEPAPVWPNLKTFPWQSFRGCVDILTGGYPCQPFSAAGKRQGADDPRHLWPYIARGIRILEPRLCFFENVEGHISLGLSDVIEDLAGMGYRTTWGIFSASEVGASHQRKRVFILAHRIGSRLEGFAWNGDDSNQPRRVEKEQNGSACASGLCCWPSRPDEQQYGWEPPRVVSSERSLGRDIDGSSGRLDYAELCVTCDNRTDELRLLGNGVVPATAERAYRTLARELLQNPS
jgi:DNA (cytosine-5)-methyltransferase 1